MIRFICIVIFVVLFLILTFPVRVVEWFLHKSSPYASDISSLRIVQWAFKVILRITGVKTTVIGEENIPDEPVLFEISRTFLLDATPALSLPRPDEPERRAQDNSRGN